MGEGEIDPFREINITGVMMTACDGDEGDEPHWHVVIVEDEEYGWEKRVESLDEAMEEVKGVMMIRSAWSKDG